MPTSWLLCLLPVQLIQLNRKGVGTGMDKCDVRLHGESSYTKNSKVRSHFIIIHLYASTLFALPNSRITFVCLVVCFLINLDILQLILQSSEPGRGFLRGKQFRDVQKWAHKKLWFRMFRLSWKKRLANFLSCYRRGHGSIATSSLWIHPLSARSKEK